MRCKQTDRLLLHYIDQDLSPGLMSMVRKHVSSCDVCAARLQLLQKICGTLDSDALRVAPNPFAFTRIMAKIEHNKENRMLPVFRIKPAVLAAAVALPLFLGVLLGSSTYKRSASAYVVANEQVDEISNLLITPGYASLIGYQELLLDDETLSK